MLVNPDFSRHAVVTPDQQHWVPSPNPSVERVMLDRLGGEHARATSLVRYAPGSVFPAHEHPGGEEILVLRGTFSDASGHYGPGWYMRNPPGTSHQPSSAEGALIFVKLWQMLAGRQESLRVDTQDPTLWVTNGPRTRCPLHSSPAEQVSLERLAPGEPLGADTTGGAEWLLLEGSLIDASACFDPRSWMRLPPGAACSACAGREGATLYLKTGHLAGIAA